MKRSELLEIMKDASERHMTSNDGFSCLEEALLNAIETSGMLPPEFLDRKRDIRILGWEPENES